MTPEEEQLKIASGELFENFRSSTIIQSKNGGLKRVREVVNDEDDFKKSKKQKSKTKMKKAIRNLQDRVAIVERQLNSIKSDIDELKGMMSTILKHIGLQRKGDEGDRKVSEGLVDHTLDVRRLTQLPWYERALVSTVYREGREQTSQKSGRENVEHVSRMFELRECAPRTYVSRKRGCPSPPACPTGRTAAARVWDRVILSPLTWFVVPFNGSSLYFLTPLQDLSMWDKV
ncbi:uncharacterized protein E6C27_scaffold132G00930 [Cucumis melo var. makuwa]|uniref:Uncharacterized protein n=1 Tax=Cucumis melo var. makuwa TaxID=1194695 RepID=A0A5A7UTZ3_CUCMM|nr:uncharacterized protein E6C27_scaffold132G00930 [Cucumis melo var. makuwa]